MLEFGERKTLFRLEKKKRPASQPKLTSRGADRGIGQKFVIGFNSCVSKTSLKKSLQLNAKGLEWLLLCARSPIGNGSAEGSV